MASKAASPPAREVRREQIIDAAVELFGEHGFRGTSVAAVADQVGVTDAGVLYHFGTKDELLLAVLDRLRGRQWGEMQTELQAAYLEGGLAGLRLVRYWGAWMENTPEENKVLLVLSAEHLTDDSAVNVYFAERYGWLLTSLAEAFEQAAKNGDIRRDVDAVLEASMLMAMMDGIRLQWFLLGPKRVSMADAMYDYVDNMIERLTA
jgi:AcrR family transcriptional regulator